MMALARRVHVADEPLRDLGNALITLALIYPLLVLILGVVA